MRFFQLYPPPQKVVSSPAGSRRSPDLLLQQAHMTRRGLSCVAPKCGIVCTFLYVLIFLSLDAVGFRAAPWASRGGTRSRDTCARMAAWRGKGEPRGKEQEAINRINLALPCSRKDMLHSVSLVARKILFQLLHDIWGPM